MEVFTNIREQIVNEDQSQRIEESLFFEILVAVVVLSLVLLALAIIKITRSEKVKAKLDRVKKQMIWNGLSITLLITHFKQCMTAS